MSRIYKITFPTKLLPKSEYTDADIKIGLTNTCLIWSTIRHLIYFGLLRWKVELLDEMTKEQAMERYELKDEAIVEPFGWWSSQNPDDWITAELMSALELASVYEIAYDHSQPYHFTEIGYTNNFDNIGKFQSVWSPLWAAKFHQRIFLVGSVEELKRLQDSDGGCMRPFEQGESGGKDDEWITKDLYRAYDTDRKKKEAPRLTIEGA